MLFATLLRRLTTTGVRKGMAGSRGWLILGVAAGGVRLLRWVAKDEPDVLYRTAIKPGDVFEVVTRPRAK
jgi:hypothetical protein